MSKPVKPVDRNDSEKQGNFAHPCGCCMNGNQDEGMRIARRRWKQNRSKYLRRKAKADIRREELMT